MIIVDRQADKTLADKTLADKVSALLILLLMYICIVLLYTNELALLHGQKVYNYASL